ncbi:hypothetical protein ACF5F1_000888 [Salmonella enterica]
MKWYRKAAVLGGFTQEILGDACMYGNGIPQNTQMGLAWYRKAAERGWLKRKKLLLVCICEAKGYRRITNKCFTGIPESRKPSCRND